MKLTKTHLMQPNIRYPILHGPGCGNVWPPPDEVSQFFLHRPGRLWYAKLSGYDHALQYIPGCALKRSSCIALAFITLSRTWALGSEGVCIDIFSKGTGTISICISMRSRSGPDILFIYFCTAPGGQRQGRSGWL